MNVFDLVATLRLDTSKYDEGLSESQEKAGKFGKGVLSALGTTAKVASGAIAAGGVAIAGVTKQATSAYSNYEQLIGGVETLFGDSADKVMKNADKAFSTAGMSVNDYMDTVTSFSASLIQATGRGEQQDIDVLKENLEAEYNATKESLSDQYDARKKYWSDVISQTKDAATKSALKEQKEADLKALKKANTAQLAELKAHNKELEEQAKAANMTSVTTPKSLEKAAELADMAIIDMSDNANKMGTSMEAIQNAYQGFAKQNYTMLDNLKLGYGGTKEEMERLMQDAERISGIKYDVSNYADIVEAIHVIQEEMGIAGTTSKEASSTIEGSMASMKAAWKNFITGLGNDNADLGKLFDDFLDAAITALEKNVIPRISTILKSISTALVKAIPKLMKDVPKIIKSVLPDLVKAVKSLVNELAKLLKTNAKDVAKGILDFVVMLVDVVVDNLPTILDAIIETAIGFLDGIADRLPELIPKILEAIILIVGTLVKNLPKIMGAIAKALFSILGNIGVELGKLFGGFSETVGKWFSGLWDGIKIIFSGVGEWFSGTFGGAWDMIKLAWSGVTSWFGGIWNGIKGAFSGVKKWFDDTFFGAAQAISIAWQGVTGFFEKVWEKIQKIFEPVVDWFKNKFKKAADAITENFNPFAIGEVIAEGAEGFKDAVMGFALDVAGGSNSPSSAQPATVAVPEQTIQNTTNVYIGGEQIDGVVTTNEQSRNYRSGGRS